MDKDKTWTDDIELTELTEEEFARLFEDMHRAAAWFEREFLAAAEEASDA